VFGRMLSPDRSRSARWGAAALVAAALLIIAPAGAQAKKPGGGGGGHGCAGAPGIGDEYFPTYGNGGYEVRHYGLRVFYNPGNDRLKGRATIHARATQKLCRFNLDLVGLTVKRVRVDGDRARFSRSGGELTVRPRGTLRDGERFRVVISYSGVPTEFRIPGTDIRTGFMATPEGATVAGQPEVAAGWFPVNDHPLDKASYFFDVTVPAGYEVAANGFLVGRSDRDRRSNWHWWAPEPMASYLATIDIADWDVTESTQAGLPVYDAVSNQITGGLRAEIDDSFSRQGEIIEMIADAYGPYPFSTAGGIVPNQDDLLFALETQTRPVYSKLFWLDRNGNPRDADWVVVHEYAHQWFGDDVALARWQDIWLNEGFASYAEWLWEEHEGNATPEEIFQATYDSIPADDPFWQVPIGDPGVEDLFSDPVYVRGAMAVHALRQEVGDADFFAIVKGFTAANSGGHGTTPEFMALAEQISGQQLDDWANTWLFSTAKPELDGEAAAAVRSARSSAATAPSYRDQVRERLASGFRY
jgi:aminopeptidase N